MTTSPLGPRPSRFPLYPEPLPASHRLPVLQDVRDVDTAARPVLVVWELTLKCDLACRHCGSRAGPPRPDELTTQEALKLVQDMKAMGVKEIALIGGEAYLHKGWLEIARSVTDNGMACTMVTGGRGFHAKRAKEAKDAGIYSISISVDGLEATHNTLRNVEGSFQSALDAMRNLRDAGVRVGCNSQINRLTLRELVPLSELLLQAGMKAWQLAITVPMGRAADEEGLLLQPYEMLEVLPLIARLSERCEAANVILWPGNNVGYFGPYESRIRARFPGKQRGACAAGRSTMGVEANGDIKGCPSLPSSSYVGGNIRDLSLKDIWQRSPELRFMRDRSVEDLWGHCRTCYYAESCLAGCNWTSHVVMGRAGNNPYCHHRALELLAKGLRERIVRRHHGDGQPFDHGAFDLVEEAWPAASLAAAQELARSGTGTLLRE